MKPDVLKPDVLKPDVFKPDVLWVYRFGVDSMNKTGGKRLASFLALSQLLLKPILWGWNSFMNIGSGALLPTPSTGDYDNLLTDICYVNISDDLFTCSAYRVIFPKRLSGSLEGSHRGHQASSTKQELAPFKARNFDGSPFNGLKEIKIKQVKYMESRIVGLNPTYVKQDKRLK